MWASVGVSVKSVGICGCFSKEVPSLGWWTFAGGRLVVKGRVCGCVRGQGHKTKDHDLKECCTKSD